MDVPDLWSRVAAVLTSTLVRTCYLFGPPGSGKSYAAYTLGRVDAGIYAITLTEDTPASELRGFFSVVGGNMTFRDGPMVEAMRKGARLVINEISHGNPETHALLYPILESVETARLTLPTNETVFPAEGFHVVVTDNLSPDDLPKALQDRFDVVIEVDEPNPDALARLDPDLLAAALRTMALEDDRRVSTRRWLSVQNLREEFGLSTACELALGRERGALLYDAIVMADGGAAARSNGRPRRKRKRG